MSRSSAADYGRLDRLLPDSTRCWGGASGEGRDGRPGQRRKFREPAPAGAPRRTISALASLPSSLGEDRHPGRRVLRICGYGAPVHRDCPRHATLERYAKDAEGHGLSIERLSGDEIRHRWPWLSRHVYSGTFSARDATANPRLVVPAVV